MAGKSPDGGIQAGEGWSICPVSAGVDPFFFQLPRPALWPLTVSPFFSTVQFVNGNLWPPQRVLLKLKKMRVSGKALCEL